MNEFNVINSSLEKLTDNTQLGKHAIYIIVHGLNCQSDSM